MKRTVKAEISYYEIACQQLLADDHSVFSIQWVVVPSAHGAKISSSLLLQLYLGYIRRFTFGLVRPHTGENGIEFRLGCTSLDLIKFSSPRQVATESGEMTVLQIGGGILVQAKQCDRGELEFRVERTGEGIKLTLQLSDYCPLLLGSTAPSLWRKWLYRLTQAYLHKVVTVRFLAMVFRSLEGYRPGIRVVKASLREGAWEL